MRPRALVAFALVALLLAAPAIALASAPASAPPNSPGPHAYWGPAPARAAAPSPAAGAAPATVPSPGWKSPYFFNDVQVTFSLPYVGPLGNFSTVPFVNTIPMAAPGFWMNITTDQPIVYANVTIWGNQWPIHNATVPVSGYDPQNPAVRPMLVNTSRPTEAYFFFDDYRFFWPGDTMFFNLTVTTVNSTPATIYSAQGQYAYPEGCFYAICNYATWIFYVQGPWVSPDFSSSVKLTTSPDVLDTPAFDPNPYQPLQIFLTGIAPPGASYGTIPAGQMQWTAVPPGQSLGQVYSQDLVPLNHSTVGLTFPIGPYPGGTNISFNFTLWLPWENGAIDRLYSPTWNFSWSTHGGWQYPNQGLLANLELFTYPDVLPPAAPSVAAATDVNVTIHEPVQNITIGSGQVNFVFHDGLGSHSGVIGMLPAGPNTSYAILPGLPPGSSVTFFVSAKDKYGVPVFSQNFTYSSTRQPSLPLPTGRDLFFFEVLDISGTGLVPSVNFTVENSTWSETRDGSTLGFGAPMTPHGYGYFSLAFGSYLVTVSAFGRSYTTILTLTNQSLFTVVFYAASGPVPSDTTSALPVIPLAAVIGLGGATGGLVIILPWFVERRKKAEEEQRRITL